MRLRIIIPRGDGEDDSRPTSTKKAETPPPTPTSYYNIPTSTASAVSLTTSTSSKSTITSTSSSSSSSSSTSKSIPSTSSAPMNTILSITTITRSSKPPSAATATSTSISSSISSSKSVLRNGSTPTAAADLLASPEPVSERPPPQEHQVLHNTLIVFGSLGIAAIIMMLLAGIFIIYQRKKKKLQPANNAMTLSDPSPPPPPMMMTNAYMPPSRSLAPDDVSGISSNGAVTPLSRNSNVSSIGSTSIARAIPMPPMETTESYSKYVPGPLNVHRDERTSLDYDPFADPEHIYDRPETMARTETRGLDTGPFADPVYERPVTEEISNSIDNPMMSPLSFIAPPYGRPPLVSTDTSASNHSAQAPYPPSPSIDGRTSKFSNFKSLLNPVSISSVPSTYSDSNFGDGSRRIESQSTVGRSSKFSNFRSLLGSKARSGSIADAVSEADERKRMEDQERTLAKLSEGQQAVQDRREVKSYF